MSVILTNTQPPLLEVSKLGAKEAQVYCFLWTSAVIDVRMDKRTDIPWSDRKDCGGTTYWSIKGIADQLGSHRQTISSAICSLLDNGFISVVGYVDADSGFLQTCFRVTHPDELENVRYAISVMGLPSVRWKQKMTNKKKCKMSAGYYDDSWLTDNFDYTYQGLYNPDNKNFCKDVEERVAKYKEMMGTDTSSLKPISKKPLCKAYETRLNKEVNLALDGYELPR